MNPVRLLLVDDEAALADLLKRYLERLGYQVDACTEPAAALQIFEDAGASHMLLISDLTLPNMNGEELFDRMRLRNPQMRAVIASGYAYQPRNSDVEFIQKPFLPKMLAETIQRVIAPR